MHKKSASKTLAPLIAIIGCDGSGKSTLSVEMAGILNKTRPTQRCYLGQGSGYLGRKIKELKIGGQFFDNIIQKRAKAVRTKGKKIPGLFTALIVCAFSLLRIRHFYRMMKLRKQGIMIITDRYPQIDVPGFYDGPGLSAAKTDNWLITKLVKWEYRRYEKMASVKPNLVLRLNVDAKTAFSRKPDHDFEVLKAKAEATPKLTFGGAPIIEIDAQLPYKDVIKEAMDLVKARMDLL